MECLPLEIKPKGIDPNRYDIRFDKELNRILGVRNYSWGEVKYEQYKIDETCGYVVGSKMKVYTSTYKEDMLNIVHVHLNDMSDEVTIETDYMQDEQSVNDFKEFKVDVSGQVLRYKILVKDMKIYSILYNTGNGIEEVPFEEVRIEA